MLIFAFYYWLSHFVSGNNEWYILPLFFVHVYCFDITCVICIVFVPSIIVCDVFCCVQWLILFLFEVLKIVVIFTERYSLFFGKCTFSAMLSTPKGSCSILWDKFLTVCIYCTFDIIFFLDFCIILFHNITGLALFSIDAIFCWVE